MAVSSSYQEAAPVRSLPMPMFDAESFTYDEGDDLIGSGAFSNVYKVQIKETGQFAAAKVLVPSKRKLPRKDIENFAKEATILFRLEKHSNIINFIGFCDSPSCCALLLEFVEGRSLREWIGCEELEPWAHRLHVLHQIVSGLRHLHESKPPVIHRDLKPENIMVQKEHGLFQCKLVDFGLSKMWTISSKFSSTHSQYPAGTTTYISPERWGLTPIDTILGKDELDKKGDIYSIGVILWEMQEMKYPFDEEIPTVIETNAKRGFLPKPSKGPPTVCSDYNNIREQCCSLYPENRPPATEVFDLISGLFGNLMSVVSSPLQPSLTPTAANAIASVRQFAAKKTPENLKQLEEMRRNLLDLFHLQRIILIGHDQCGKSSLINSFNFVVNLICSLKARYREVAHVSSLEVGESPPSVKKFSKTSSMYADLQKEENERFQTATLAGPIFADTSGLANNEKLLSAVLQECLVDQYNKFACKGVDELYEGKIKRAFNSICSEKSQREWTILFVIPATTFREKTYPESLAKKIVTSLRQYQHLYQSDVTFFIAATKVDLLGDEETATFLKDIASKFCPIFKIGRHRIYPIANYICEDRDLVFGEMERKLEKEVMIIKAFLQILNSCGKLKQEYSY
eukprot:m.206733 g.206733  ORF g.206733 m.206733 type:complete len:628 (+) comp39680_c0_seq28:171-2054(+)